MFWQGNGDDKVTMMAITLISDKSAFGAKVSTRGTSQKNEIGKVWKSMG